MTTQRQGAVAPPRKRRRATTPTVALGTIVFQRTERLERLLESVPGESIDTVYVGDNGRTNDRSALYARDFPFELVVRDIEYDAGIGASRRRVAEACSEDYLVVVDCDMEAPQSVGRLIDLLEADGTLGGVSGVVFEDGTLRSHCHDLFEHDTYKGRVLVRGIRAEPPRRTIDGTPYPLFDFLVNAAAFRRRCIDDYCWDDRFEHSFAHLDFYLGHAKTTEWRFGVCPAVVFPHASGGDETYLAHRHDDLRYTISRERFLRKWGYADVIYDGRRDWIQPDPGFSRRQRLKRAVANGLPTKYRVPLSDALGAISIDTKL